MGIDILRKLISDMESPWEGAKLTLRQLADFPRPPKVRMTFQVDVPGCEIMAILEGSNPEELKINSWRILNKVQPKNGKTTLVLRIPEESKEALTRLGNKLSFSTYQVPVVFLSQEESRRHQALVMHSSKEIARN